MNIKNQENLIKRKKIETKNIFIDKKSYKDLVICFLLDIILKNQ